MGMGGRLGRSSGIGLLTTSPGRTLFENGQLRSHALAHHTDGGENANQLLGCTCILQGGGLQSFIHGYHLQFFAPTEEEMNLLTTHRKSGDGLSTAFEKKM